MSLATQCYGVTSNGVGGSDKIRLGADKATLVTGIRTAKGPMELVTSYPAREAGIRRSNQASVETKPPSRLWLMDLRPTWPTRPAFQLCARFGVLHQPEAAGTEGHPGRLALPTSYEFDARMKALAEKHLGVIDWTKNPVSIIDWIYGDDKRGAFGIRKTAKAVLSGIRVPDRPTKPDHDPTEVQTRLAELRRKHATETKKVSGGGTTQIGRIDQSLTQQRDKLATAHEARRTASAELARIEGELLDGPTLTRHRKVAANRVKYDELTLRSKSPRLKSRPRSRPRRSLLNSSRTGRQAAEGSGVPNLPSENHRKVYRPSLLTTRNSRTMQSTSRAA